MQISDELTQAVTSKLEPYGIVVENAEIEQAFWSVINAPINQGGDYDSILIKTVREVWNAKVAQVEANAGNQQDDGEPDPDPAP